MGGEMNKYIPIMLLLACSSAMAEFPRMTTSKKETEAVMKCKAALKDVTAVAGQQLDTHHKNGNQLAYWKLAYHHQQLVIAHTHIVSLRYNAALALFIKGNVPAETLVGHDMVILYDRLDRRRKYWVGESTKAGNDVATKLVIKAAIRAIEPALKELKPMIDAIRAHLKKKNLP